MKNPHFHDWTWDENGDVHRGPAHNFSINKVVKDTTIAIGTGYLVYKTIRLLPSLIPAFWWTIPANLATP